MDLSNSLGITGVILLAIAIYLAMGLAYTLGFLGLALIILSLILAMPSAGIKHGDSE